AALELVPDPLATRSELAALQAVWRSAATVRIGRDGRWFAPPAKERVDLGRRRNLWRVLAALAERRAQGSRAPIFAGALLEAAWPGEQMDIESGRNRVRVAIATLRDLGLRDVLVSRDGGYLLDPDVPLSVETEI